MKKMTKKALVKKIEDEKAEVNAFSMENSNILDVTFFNRDGSVKRRESVQVTGNWPEGWGN